MQKKVKNYCAQMYLCCRIARRQFEHSFQPTVHAISDDAKPYVPRNYSV